MNLELRQLRALVAVADEGTFTDAAIALRISQAAVSRTIAALEDTLGHALVQRTTRKVELTPAGLRVLDHSRRILAEADLLIRSAGSEQREVRLGYAWAALGSHTSGILRAWAGLHPDTELILVTQHSRMAGLHERVCDVAVIRHAVDDPRLESVTVGIENRFAALPAHDGLARKKAIRLADLAGRIVAIDTVVGTTSASLWPPDAAPSGFRETTGIDEWLTVIEAGHAVGMTAEATRHQHPRPGVVFRPVRDAAPVAVSLAWRRDDPPTGLADLIRLAVTSYGQRNSTR